MVWTPALHARFEEVVSAIGLDTAVPMSILAVRPTTLQRPRPNKGPSYRNAGCSEVNKRACRYVSLRMADMAAGLHSLKALGM